MDSSLESFIFSKKYMKIDVILGLQWGDEGKGKIVDYLAEYYDLVCRFQGGPNAGHTIKFDEHKFVLHTIPSGIFRDHIINVIGNGVVIDPITLDKEIQTLRKAGKTFMDRLLVAKKAHLILPTHRYLDAASEAAKGKAKIGSTLKGIGPTYMDKTGRNGLRVGDIALDNFMEKYAALKAKHISLLKLYPEIDFNLEEEEAKWFKSLEVLKTIKQIDCGYFVNEHLKKGKKILAEGAQGSMLDIDFGTYPYVTSSNTITAGVCTGLGVAPQTIGEVIGIAKAYCTRVGSGPFPTELDGAVGEELRAKGQEFGATTGRPRRCGWIDLPQIRYAIMLNGVTQIVLTKADILNDFQEIMISDSYEVAGNKTRNIPYDMHEIPVNPSYRAIKGWQQDLSECANYEAFPEALKSYVSEIEKELDTPISMVSIGPKRKELIIKN